MSERPLSERVRDHATGMPITPNDTTLLRLADEIAALEAKCERARDLCDEMCACEEGRTCTACRIKAELERRGA